MADVQRQRCSCRELHKLQELATALRKGRDQTVGRSSLGTLFALPARLPEHFSSLKGEKKEKKKLSLNVLRRIGLCPEDHPSAKVFTAASASS